VIELRPLDAEEVADWRARVTDRLVAIRVAAGVPEPQARDRVAWFDRTGSPGSDDEHAVLRAACRDGATLGTLWAATDDHGSAHVRELAVPVSDAAETLAVLGTELAGRGITALRLDVLAGDPVMSAALADADPRLVATQMQLDLTGDFPQGRIELRRMTPETYDDYRSFSSDQYAEELFASGSYPDLDSAVQGAAQQFDELLPGGPDTPGAYLWTAWHGDDAVARLWVGVKARWAFIYDIEVEDEHRGRGFGTDVLNAGARACQDLGARWLGLNVFGHNDGARRLYERLGFDTTELSYTVSVGPAHPD
jgi:ribosomal protein S18 acetylase RimI-like enzyme